MGYKLTSTDRKHCRPRKGPALVSNSIRKGPALVTNSRRKGPALVSNSRRKRPALVSNSIRKTHSRQDRVTEHRNSSNGGDAWERNDKKFVTSQDRSTTVGTSITSTYRNTGLLFSTIAAHQPTCKSSEDPPASPTPLEKKDSGIVDDNTAEGDTIGFYVDENMVNVFEEYTMSGRDEEPVDYRSLEELMEDFGSPDGYCFY